MRISSLRNKLLTFRPLDVVPAAAAAAAAALARWRIDGMSARSLAPAPPAAGGRAKVAG